MDEHDGQIPKVIQVKCRSRLDTDSSRQSPAWRLRSAGLEAEKVKLCRDKTLGKMVGSHASRLSPELKEPKEFKDSYGRDDGPKFQMMYHQLHFRTSEPPMPKSLVFWQFLRSKDDDLPQPAEALPSGGWDDPAEGLFLKHSQFILLDSIGFYLVPCSCSCEFFDDKHCRFKQRTVRSLASELR